MLHRKGSWLEIALSSILLVSMLSGLSWAQRRPMPNEDEEPRPAPRKKVKGPRAVGVIEIAPNGKARLVPVAILVGEKWFDAGVYMADPRPMALEPETVYEGEVAGDSAGLFTITGLATTGDNFVGLGTWKPAGSEEPKKKKVTLEPAMPSGSLTADDDERPRLKRPKPADSEPKKDAPAQTPSATPAPAPAGEGAKQASSTPAATQEKKPAEAPAPKPARSSEEDANRPRLRRGTAGVEQAEGIAMPSAASDFATAPGKQGAPAPAVNFKRIAAISDAGGPQPRSYVYHATPGEAADYKRKMIPLAQESLQKFVSVRMKGVQTPAITDQNSKLEIFDISSNNDPVLVLTVRIPAGENAPKPEQPVRPKARLASKSEPALKPAPAVEYDETIVARVSLTGELRKIFDNVTDSTRLDAYPKMDLIDAVDANGDSVGELLFREQYDRGHAYVIYRVGLDKLWPLFEGEQRQF